MSLKSWVVKLSVLLFALSQGALASAATITRDSTTARTPNAADFPSTYNSHPWQVGYIANTTVNSGDNHMFRDTIPIVCERGQRLAGASLIFRLVKIRNGPDAGNNDTMNFWLNGQKKYEFNVGAAAMAGVGVNLSIDLAALPPVGTGPNTITATYSSYVNPISMIPDIRASQRLSFAIQDDTNINFMWVTYTCEKDPDFVTEPITVDPCCPPWNSTNLLNSLQYTGSGPIGAPYTLKFTPSPGLIGALQAYLNYINQTNSALTNLLIEFQLYYHGPVILTSNGTPVGPVSGMKLTANSTNVQLHTNYNTNTPAIFTGVATPGTSTTPSSYPMQVGMWYLVHTGMWTDSADFFDKARCSNVDVYIRIVFIKGLRQTAPRAVLELMNSSRTKTKTIPLDGSDFSLPIQSLPGR